MKRGTIAAVLLLFSSPSFAISRYDPTEIPCASVQEIVSREGEVILRYGSSSILGLPVFDRYVADRAWCGPGEVARTAGVPSADQKYCPVKKCVESDIFVDR
jgi:hypothetical protein